MQGGRNPNNCNRCLAVGLSNCHTILFDCIVHRVKLSFLMVSKKPKDLISSFKSAEALLQHSEIHMYSHRCRTICSAPISLMFFFCNNI